MDRFDMAVVDFAACVILMAAKAVRRRGMEAASLDIIMVWVFL